jgi:type I pantothenate kinase
MPSPAEGIKSHAGAQPRADLVAVRYRPYAGGQLSTAGDRMTRINRNWSSYFYDWFTRAQWTRFGAGCYRLSAEALASLKGINEPMSVAEVDEVVGPLCGLLDQQLSADPARPYVIAVSGSVAVGKSTFSRVLRALLAQSNRTAELVATDGFLWPTAILEKRDLMGRKGFPESYDLDSMLNFLADLKAGKADLRVPVYSHEVYDIVPGQFQTVNRPELLIFEGLNVLQGSKGSEVVAADYFDFSIYLEADPNDVENWYIERFSVLQRTVFQRPTSYFHHYKDLDPQETRETGRRIWRTINLPNLLQNIQPTRERATVVLRKGRSHAVEEVLWRHSMR